MKTESPFKDRPGFLSFEDFYLLPIGTPVETVDTHSFVHDRWSRQPIKERDDPYRWSPQSDGVYLGDAGIVPYPHGRWREDRYTRLATPKPPSEIEQLRNELKAAQETVERLAAKIEEMSK